VRTDDEEHLGGAAAVAAVEEAHALPLVAALVPVHLAVRHCYARRPAGRSLLASPGLRRDRLLRRRIWVLVTDSELDWRSCRIGAAHELNTGGQKIGLWSGASEVIYSRPRQRASEPESES
jgi:hypothetical protein